MKFFVSITLSLISTDNMIYSFHPLPGDVDGYIVEIFPQYRKVRFIGSYLVLHVENFPHLFIQKEHRKKNIISIFLPSFLPFSFYFLPFITLYLVLLWKIFHKSDPKHRGYIPKGGVLPEIGRNCGSNYGS
jgi:hypothetical protein